MDRCYRGYELEEAMAPVSGLDSRPVGSGPVARGTMLAARLGAQRYNEAGRRMIRRGRGRAQGTAKSEDGCDITSHCVEHVQQ